VFSDREGGEESSPRGESKRGDRERATGGSAGSREHVVTGGRSFEAFLCDNSLIVQFLKSAAISAVLYAAGFAAASVLLFVFLGVWRSPEVTLRDNLAMAGYMLAVTAIPAAIGFGLATYWSKAWRSQRLALLAVLSLAGGALTEFLFLTGLALLPGNLLLPRSGGMVLVALKLLLPGVLVGFLELGVARLLRPRVVS
jgi:hypothetical protein